MGASESTEIQVNFNHPNLFYYAGEQITGDISFQSTREKLILDQVFLEFIGELGYTTQEKRHHHRNNTGRTHIEHYTEYHRVPFMNTRIPVVRPQHGQSEITLNRGHHSWPFELQLPPCLPPSSTPSTVAYPYVIYYARVVLDKPWYKPNAKQVYNLIIFPRVNINQIQNVEQPVPFSHINRKKVQLEGNLLRNSVIPGKKLSLEINLHNPKRTEIKRIEAILIQHRQIAQSQQSEIIFRANLPNIREFNETELHRTVHLLVPTGYLAPTYTYIPRCCGPLLGIDFSYELQLQVKVRGVFTDFNVSVPVTIGTESTSNHQQLPSNSLEMSIANAPPLYDFDELPPSYDSVITKAQV